MSKGAYSRMGAYYRDVVVVIELGAYIHVVLTFNGCLLSRFYCRCPRAQNLGHRFFFSGSSRFGGQATV